MGPPRRSLGHGGEQGPGALTDSDSELGQDGRPESRDGVGKHRKAFHCGQSPHGQCRVGRRSPRKGVGRGVGKGRS